MSGDLGDGGAVVAGEPGGLDLTGGQAAGERDLERALAEADLGWGRAVAEVSVDQAVETVVEPVQFFLEGDHLVRH